MSTMQQTDHGLKLALTIAIGDLRDVEDALMDRADADVDDRGVIPSFEMRQAMRVQRVREKLEHVARGLP